MKLFSRPAVRTVRRSVKIGLSILAAVLAVAIVGSLTVDLGPRVRELGERAGSKQIERPLHIGRLSIHLLTGHVIVENLVIDGLHSGDRPFFTAKRLTVTLDWTTAFRTHPEITITAVEMTDWTMVVEKWENAHNFPKFSRDKPKEDDGGTPRVTTTLRYLHAWRGQFTYDDHETPWQIVCPNLDINIGNLPAYHGEAVFTGGTVKIQDHLPMWVNMKARFVLDGPHIRLTRIDLDTDGTRSVVKGDVDAGNFPEMTFQVQSKLQFPRMRQIFFTDDAWEAFGEGDFTGTFHLFKGGHDLSGKFSSAVLGVNDYRFPSTYGLLRWTPRTFDVWDAGSKFYGGDARFTFSIKQAADKAPRDARFDVSYANVDLAAVTDFERLKGVRFAGTATGRSLLAWPLGRFSAGLTGDGQIEVAPPPGVVPMGVSLAAARVLDADHARHEWGPFAPQPMPEHLPIAGGVTYRIVPDQVTFEGGRFATEHTRVDFRGSTAWGERSRFSFHVSSGDWQESDELLAGLLTDFGSPAAPVAFGGRGEFDGAMTGPFRRPRVEGDFVGEDLRAWDTLWGAGTAHLVVENGYVTIADSLVRLGESQIHADGLFSLGYPRDDHGEQINARFRVTGRDLDGLRHAFRIDEYPVSGQLSGEFHLTGEYERPVGFGGMAINNGVAYGEPFQAATAALRFDGTGVRLDGIHITKGIGTVTGAAFVGWDSTYSLNADGRRIPMESLAMFAFPRAPLTGLAEFTASGSGTFDVPRNDVRFRVDDMFVADEGVGQVTGTLALRGTELSGQIDAASPRLALTGTGRIALGAQADADLAFRFHDSSLDPYVRLFVPKLSPFTTAIASGSVRISGGLANLDRLVVDGTVDALDIRLFDYALRNAAPIRLDLNQRRVTIRDLQLVGDDTRLRLDGTVGLSDRRIALQATGDANLGILQGFFREVRGAGHAELMASIDGPLDRPLFSGRAILSGGRIRHFSLPNSLDAIDGTLYFDAGGIRFDGVTARMGGGTVQFGGRVGFDGYAPSELNVTARGSGMRLRYPEGVRSVVDADLAVRGTLKAPLLGGTVTVREALWSRRIDAPGSLFEIGGRRGTGGAGGGGGSVEAASIVPVRFDVQILVPSTLRIENNLVRMVASADLTLRGTYERPVLLGHTEIERGEVVFEGRRYRVTHGAIDFANPNRIEPFFDVAAETTVRVPGQTYRITVTAAGTADRMQPALSSDPPLPQGDVLALLFGETRRTQDAELRALQNPNERQTDILAARATQALASPLSAEVGRVVEQTFGVDTFQLSPSLIDRDNPQSGRLNPSARLTIGKRISNRVYLTFSRSLNTTVYDQIILLEYDATDRLSWIMYRNEDQTYAIEFRVRHTF